ncbi:MAG: DUF2029 domain-containing protein [Candidatus Melainabacteria bacterium]|nr:MAG: DUF2029 domain-containing protein [Candidatus Melainabacteria bacterium]
MTDTAIFSRSDRIKSLALRVIAFVLLSFSCLMIAHKLIVPLSDARWFIDKKTNEYHVIDFFQYYQASELARSKLDSCNVYNPDRQRTWFNDLVAPLSSNEVFYNQQPPNFFPFLYPISLLPANFSYVIWCILQTSFGLTSLFALGSCGSLSKKDRVLFLLGVLASFPAYSLIWHGNTTFWLVGWLSAYVLCFLKKRDILGGVFMSFATFKPQYMFLMLLPALAGKRIKLLAAFAITELILLGIASVIIGADNVISYPSIVKKAESYAGFIGVNPQVMISLRGVFAQFLSIHDSLTYTSSLMFLSLIPMFFVWTKYQTEEKNLQFLWALTICTAVLLSPHCHVFDFLLLSMAAILTLKQLSILKLSSELTPYRIWCAIFLLFPLASWIANYALGHKLAPIAFFFPVILALSILSFINLRSENAKA